METKFVQMNGLFVPVVEQNNEWKQDDTEDIKREQYPSPYEMALFETLTDDVAILDAVYGNNNEFYENIENELNNQEKPTAEDDYFVDEEFLEECHANVITHNIPIH